VQDRSTNLWYSAEYWSFKIGDELNDKYRLEVSGYSGDAGDSLQYGGDYNGNGRYLYNHNGMHFSTYDQDNDPSTNNNCAAWRRGGWWFNRCYWACLTCKEDDYMWWKPTFVVCSRMMIKPQ